ncbi:MAG: HD domain-containing phosphohydrolase [Candidatus Izemoplasmatales bacterium]
MKITKKTLIIVIAYILFSFVTMAFFFTVAYVTIKDNQEESLTLELENSKNQILQDFLKIETILLNLESQVITNDSDTDLLNLIIDIDQKSDIISSLYLGKPDKTMVNSSGFVPGPDFDLTTRIWYERAVQSDEVIITPAFINQTANRVIVTLAKAVYIDDVLAGVIATDIDIMAITNFVSEKQIGENGFAFLIDENDNLIAYPGLEIDDIRLHPLDELDPNLEIISGSGTQSDFTIGENTGVLKFETIQPYNYTIGIFIPETEFNAGLKTISDVFIYLSVSMFVLSVVLLLVYNLRVKKPLEILLNDIDKIDISSSTDYRLPEPNKDEYLPVRKSINNVIEATNFYFKKNIKTRDLLAIENQRVKLLMESTADIIFEANIDNEFVSVFGKGLEIINLKSADFIGKKSRDIFEESGLEREKMYNKALKGEHIIYDWDFKKEEKILHFESSISPIYNQDKQIIGIVDIARDITVPMEKQKEIEYISIHDFLTGLYNRRYFVEAFVDKDKPANYPLAIMMIDLNGLKILNDAYGHDSGDSALKQVASVLKDYASEKDTVCRIGGDEFVIISTKTNTETLEKTKELIRDKLAKLYVKNIPLSVAIGYEIKTTDSTTFEEIMKNAENQMYRNKVTEGRSIRNKSIVAILKTFTDKFEEEEKHSKRVSELCRKMGEALNIKSDDLKELEIAGLYHDIGKIAIPEKILRKPGKLTKEEFSIVKTHTENGYNILRAADEYSNLAEYALSHHENWDGSGYPRGLKGKEIPLYSRIIRIADAYEAMTSDRVYRKALDEDIAVEEILKGSGSQFDPKLVKVFIEKVLKK